MKQRLREMDFIRAISALSIIVIHVSGTYVTSSRGAYTINQLVRFAVPVFILISGLLLSLSGYRSGGIAGYWDFLVRRFRKIFVPYLLWSFLYILFKMRDDLSQIWTNPLSFAVDSGRKLLFGSAYAHLYFIIIILQFYLLFPALRYLLKRYPKMTLACSFLLTLVFQTGVYLQAMKLFVLPAPVLPNYMFFPTWVFYFVFGMFFSEKLESRADRFAKQAGLLVPAWIVGFLLLMADSRITDTYDLSIRPSVMIYSILTFLLMYSLAVRFRESRLIVLKGLEWVSLQSFPIYLCHLLVIKVILLATGHDFANAGIWTGIKGMLLLYLIATIVTFLVSYLISVTPVASIFGAVGRKRNKTKAAVIES